MTTKRAWNFRDRTGQKCGRLTVLSLANDCKPLAWRCACQCGSTIIVPGSNLQNGNTQSCGCLRREMTAKAFTKHGKRFSKTYRIWRAMKMRCTVPTNINYADYGGRGIRVCQRWFDSFEAFIKDVGECPDELTIDRIDTNGHYEPGNVRWATQQRQCRNKRNNRRLTFGGKTQTAIEWSEELGINVQTIYSRLKRGWKDERILTVSVADVPRESLSR